MRAVIQRVSRASVSIEQQIKAEIQRGLVILLGIEQPDGPDDSEWLARKIAQLRIFDDEQGLMNRSVLEVQGDILLISQFTLFARTAKGNRPSYSRAAKGEVAIPIYRDFIVRLEAALGHPIQTGEFGANMAVSLVNEGPVTIHIDTKSRE